MKIFKENKELLIKYLFIAITNLLLFIFCNFYLKNYMYKDVIILILGAIINLIIYSYKEKLKFIWYYDFILNFIVGIILMCFFNDSISYGTVLFSLILSNNIVFFKSRLSDKFLKRSLQYILVIINSILSLFINMCIFNLIF